MWFNTAVPVSVLPPGPVRDHWDVAKTAPPRICQSVMFDRLGPDASVASSVHHANGGIWTELPKHVSTADSLVLPRVSRSSMLSISPTFGELSSPGGERSNSVGCRIMFSIAKVPSPVVSAKSHSARVNVTLVLVSGTVSDVNLSAPVSYENSVVAVTAVAI